ncbi:MAG: hypothetical protein LAP40_00475 [Acidobacteriia bacterium]|nr:hypothetical protein [Terriglobia bacterium]
MSLDLIPGDRRIYRRYECQLDLRFEHQDRAGAITVGHGVTADLSTGALRFFPDQTLPPGSQTEARVAWPFLLQNVCPLELVLKGTVSAVTGRGTILAIRSYEFRTCGARSFWETPPASSMWKVA